MGEWTRLMGLTWEAEVAGSVAVEIGLVVVEAERGVLEERQGLG